MSSFKAVGYRYVMPQSKTGQKRKRDTAIGRELEAVEWMPDVIEHGLVYEDKIVNLAGDRVIAKKVKTAAEQLLEEIAEGFVVRNIKKLSIGMKALVGKSPIKKKSLKKFWQSR